jgi:formylglycine-generating enzyme required for sulfatase activity
LPGHLHDRICQGLGVAACSSKDLARRFGPKNMEAYVQDPAAYQKARARAAKAAALKGSGAAAIPEGYVAIEAGEFVMGSPVGEGGRDLGEVQHRVTLTRPFLLKATPFTQGEWRELMGNNPSRFSTDGPDGEPAADRPVESVSWYSAVACCNALSEREGLTPFYELTGVRGTPGTGDYVTGDVACNASANGYRLPTEAEWEYAARAGSQRVTYAEAGQNLGDIAWFRANADKRTHPVLDPRKLPNGWGLHGMHGNVYQWVQDRYGDLTTAGASDPQGSSTGGNRVCRGGSWNSTASNVRAAGRCSGGPSVRYGDLGFRPARSL